MGVETTYDYDAIVIYLPNSKDEEFAEELSENLQRSEGGARLLLPYRDMPELAQDLTTLKELIDVRCRRCIAVVSEDSIADPFTMAVVNFGISISAGYEVSRVIPVVIEKCILPRSIVTLTVCDITKTDMLPWMWRRLHRAIKTNTASMTHYKKRRIEVTNPTLAKKSTSECVNKSKLSKLYGILQFSPKMKYANLSDLS